MPSTSIVIMGNGINSRTSQGRPIQKSQLRSMPPKNAREDAKVARKFSNLMMEGKVRAALQLLTNEARSAPAKSVHARGSSRAFS